MTYRARLFWIFSLALLLAMTVFEVYMGDVATAAALGFILGSTWEAWVRLR